MTDTWHERGARELRRLEEDTRLSAKSHYNAGAAWSALHYLLGVPTAVLSASAAIATKLSPELTLPLALLATVLAALLTFIKAAENASLHKTTGDELLALNGALRRFRELSLDDCATQVEAADEISKLAARKDHLNRGAPSIPWFAFSLAKRGIAQGEAQYEVDAE